MNASIFIRWFMALGIIAVPAFSQGSWSRMQDVSYLGFRDLVVLGDGSVHVRSHAGIFRAEGDSLFWREIHGYGGQITGLIADTRSPRGMVIGGGQFTLYRTSDGGDVWNAIGGATGNSIRSLFPGSPGIYYVICSPDGIIRVRESQGSQRIINGLHDDWWYLKDGLSFGDARVLVYQSPSAVYYSSNNGDSWDTASDGLDGMSVLSFHAEGNTAWIATEAHGVMRATTPVSTWMSASAGLGNPGDPSMSVRLLVRDPRGPLVALTRAGLYSSNNNGDSWDPFGTADPEWFNARRMLIHPDGRYFILYGSDSVFVSSDNAQSWQLHRAGLHLSEIRDVLVYGNALFVAGADCVFQSGAMRNTTWHQQIAGLSEPRISKLFMRPDSTVMAFDISGGLHVWHHLPDHWTPHGTGLQGEKVRCTAESPGGMLFAGTESGRVFRSTDGGLQWSHLLTAPNASSVASLLCATDTIIFAGTFGSGMYRSQDGGQSWQTVAGGMNHPNVTALVQTPDGDIFAGSYGAGVFLSHDHGSTWTSVSAGLDNPYITSMVSNHIGVIAVGTYGNSVYYTRNKGASWVHSNTRIGDARVLGLYLTESQQLVAAVEGGTLWYTDGSLPTAVLAPPAPNGFRLLSVYPNPLLESTTLSLETQTPENLRISLCDLLGREVACIQHGPIDPGIHEIPIRMDNLSAGTYALRVQGLTGFVQHMVTRLHTY